MYASICARIGVHKSMSRLRRGFWAGIALVGLAAAGGAALAWHPALPAITPPHDFARAQVARGATLAALGDCAVCHTAQGGAPFAGGRMLATPFGGIAVTNISPDPATGIGAWSEAAFRRAMRDGIDRGGRQLYPALPYPHFTRATDDDIAALYAFLMTRPPVAAVAPPNRLPFPLNIRATVAGWNLLFLRPGRWRPDPAHDAVFNRGAYLVAAVGHCAACHTPHNLLGAEQDSHALGGGATEGWYAPPLAEGARGWSVAQLEDYLRTGLSAQHGVAAGPMTAVTRALATVPADDVHAIATYIAAGMPARMAPVPMPKKIAGNAVFAGACGGCHAADAPMNQAGAPPLSVSAALDAPTPDSAVRVVLHGIPWREGEAAPYMPPFAASFSDDQVAAVVGYLRDRYSDRPAWTDIGTAVRTARTEGDTAP